MKANHDKLAQQIKVLQEENEALHQKIKNLEQAYCKLETLSMFTDYTEIDVAEEKLAAVKIEQGKGGRNSAKFREHEKLIMKYFSQYRYNKIHFIKSTLSGTYELICTEILKVDQRNSTPSNDTLKRYWKNYQNSKGISIF